MKYASALWAKEPAIVTALGSIAFWAALFNLLTAFGHGLTQSQEQAVSAFAVLLAGWIIRGQVEPTSGATNPPPGGGKLPAVLLACALAGSAMLGSACATAGAFDKQSEALVHQAIKSSEDLHAANVLDDAQFRSVNLELNRVAVAGREYTKLLKAGTAKPADAGTFVAALEKAVRNLQAAPYGATVAKVLSYLLTLDAKVHALIGQ